MEPAREIDARVKSKFSLMLRVARMNQGITQRELAEKVGYATPASICLLETGARGPTVGQLVSCCQALGLKLEDAVRA